MSSVRDKKIVPERETEKEKLLPKITEENSYKELNQILLTYYDIWFSL